MDMRRWHPLSTSVSRYISYVSRGHQEFRAHIAFNVFLQKTKKTNHISYGWLQRAPFPGADILTNNFIHCDKSSSTCNGQSTVTLHLTLVVVNFDGIVHSKIRSSRWQSTLTRSKLTESTWKGQADVRGQATALFRPFDCSLKDHMMYLDLALILYLLSHFYYQLAWSIKSFVSPSLHQSCTYINRFSSPGRSQQLTLLNWHLDSRARRLIAYRPRPGLIVHRIAIILHLHIASAYCLLSLPFLCADARGTMWWCECARIYRGSIKC